MITQMLSRFLLLFTTNKKRRAGVGVQKKEVLDCGGKYFYEVKVSEYKNRCIYFKGKQLKTDMEYRDYCVAEEFREKLISISSLFLDRPVNAF